MFQNFYALSTYVQFLTCSCKPNYLFMSSFQFLNCFILVSERDRENICYFSRINRTLWQLFKNSKLVYSFTVTMKQQYGTFWKTLNVYRNIWNIYYKCAFTNMIILRHLMLSLIKIYNQMSNTLFHKEHNSTQFNAIVLFMCQVNSYKASYRHSTV
jgi:hypothetical protein